MVLFCTPQTYGILCSEIFFEQTPYNGNTNLIAIANGIVDSGMTPSLEGLDVPALRELIEMCSKYNPAERPTMSQIVEFWNTRMSEVD